MKSPNGNLQPTKIKIDVRDKREKKGDEYTTETKKGLRKSSLQL